MEQQSFIKVWVSLKFTDDSGNDANRYPDEVVVREGSTLALLVDATVNQLKSIIPQNCSRVVVTKDDARILKQFVPVLAVRLTEVVVEDAAQYEMRFLRPSDHLERPQEPKMDQEQQPGNKHAQALLQKIEYDDNRCDSTIGSSARVISAGGTDVEHQTDQTTDEGNAGVEANDANRCGMRVVNAVQRATKLERKINAIKPLKEVREKIPRLLEEFYNIRKIVPDELRA